MAEADEAAGKRGVREPWGSEGGAPTWLGRGWVVCTPATIPAAAQRGRQQPRLANSSCANKPRLLRWSSGRLCWPATPPTPAPAVATRHPAASNALHDITTSESTHHHCDAPPPLTQASSCSSPPLLQSSPTGAEVCTFGRTFFCDDKPSHFCIKNDTIVAVATGDSFSLILTQLGRVFALGRNSRGQLGLGHNTNTTKPTLISSKSA